MSLIEVKVPDIGDFKDVPVITVMVKPGDHVAQDDPLIELESDKATMEVPAPVTGDVHEIRVKVGDKVTEGAVILTLEVVDAKAPIAPPSPGGEQVHEPKSPQQTAAPAPVRAPAPAGERHSEDFGETDGTAPHASPSVRAFARQVGVDLAGVKGSGRKGRVLREDVVAAMAKPAPAAAAPAALGGMGIPPIPRVDFAKFGPVADVEMSRIKRISGPALHRSWLNIPHVTHNDEADITDLEAWRRELDEEAKKQNYRVTLLAFVIRAAVSALKAHWEVNSSIHPDGDKLIRKDYWHIGFAADTPQGLVVPVIRNADAKGIVQLSKELGELSARARDGKLKGEEMQGASFTISSLGGIGGTSFTPIVNAPEVAILGLTRSKMAPVWDGTQFVPRLMQPLSLSYDHRAIDGALAARFCVTLKTVLGDIRRLML